MRSVFTTNRKHYREVRVELTTATLRRIERWAWHRECSIPEQTVWMMRFALKSMYPPRTPAEWRKSFEREDWQDVWRTAVHLMKLMVRRAFSIPDKPFLSRYADEDSTKFHKITLQVPEKMMSRVEEMARFKLIPVSEACEYVIDYALREVFPERSSEETDRELREMWQKILRGVWSG